MTTADKLADALTVKTGWPAGLMQDDERNLSRWFASRPDARREAREVAAQIQDMNMTNELIEVTRRVYVEGELGVFLEVAPWPEVPGYLVIDAPGEKNKEWFGKQTQYSMTPKFARALGEALIASANELDQP